MSAAGWRGLATCLSCFGFDFSRTRSFVRSVRRRLSGHGYISYNSAAACVCKDFFAGCLFVVLFAGYDQSMGGSRQVGVVVVARGLGSL